MWGERGRQKNFSELSEGMDVEGGRQKNLFGTV